MFFLDKLLSLHLNCIQREREREREREKQRQRQRDRQTDRERECVWFFLFAILTVYIYENTVTFIHKKEHFPGLNRNLLFI